MKDSLDDDDDEATEKRKYMEKKNASPSVCSMQCTQRRQTETGVNKLTRTNKAVHDVRDLTSVRYSTHFTAGWLGWGAG